MYGPASGGRDRGGGGRGGGRGERRMTARGQMSGGNQRPPLSDLPANMKMMFEPRKMLEYKPPIKKPKLPPYQGIAAYTSLFETTPPPPIPEFENAKDRNVRLKIDLMKANEEKNELLLADWDPKRNFKATENPFRTLFVGRLSFETTEKKLKREFEQYGPIRYIRMVTNNEGKPRGYAFIEFEKDDDMTTAYKKADGKKLDDRRIVVDVERGRTVRNWRPRRLGGGLGGRKEKKSKQALEEEDVRAKAEAARARAAANIPPAPRSEERRDKREREDGNGKYGPPSGGGDADRRDKRPRSSDRQETSSYEPRRSAPGLGSVALSRPRSRSRSRDRPDRDRDRDRGDRERDRDRDRDKDRGDRDKDRGDRGDRDRDRDRGGDRGRADRDGDRDRDRARERERR